MKKVISERTWLSFDINCQILSIIQHYNSRTFLLRNNRYHLITKTMIFFNPQAPVAQKIEDDAVFRRFQGEGVEFF